MSNPQQELPLDDPNTDNAILEILEALKAITLDTRKTISFDLPKASRHLQKALDLLGYEAKAFSESTALYTSGRYIFHHEGYEKEVTAEFDEQGNLMSLVDNDGISWKAFAVDYGVFDPRRVSCFLRQAE